MSIADMEPNFFELLVKLRVSSNMMQLFRTHSKGCGMAHISVETGDISEDGGTLETIAYCKCGRRFVIRETYGEQPKDDVQDVSA